MVNSDWLLIVIALGLIAAGGTVLKWLATRAIKGLDEGQTEIKATLVRIEDKIVGKAVCGMRHELIDLKQANQQRDIDIVRQDITVLYKRTDGGKVHE
jgi:hypothetical protein